MNQRGEHSVRDTPAPTDAATRFAVAQQRVVDRYRVEAQARFVEVPSTGGHAQVLVAGDGPPVVMVIGGTVPAVFWAPLMAQLPGHTLYAIELPGFGLTGPASYHPSTLRATAVAYLTDVLDALGLAGCPFLTQSMGSQWTVWLAEEQPDRVRSQVMIGCPAFFLDTSAPLPMRLASVPGLGRLLLAQRPSAKGTERVLRMVGEDPTGLVEIRDVLLAAQQMPAYVDSMLALMRAVMRWTRPRSEAVVPAAELRAVRHPVRLVWGDADPFGPVAAGRRAAALLPDADLHEVRGGHAPWFHHAEQIAGLTRRFLHTH